ncbi:pyridoxamine 5'-phosphate oxidase family protein [Sphingobacterium prati]|uniref:pyridoxamine 5'-phosphate oxidase family protein n=1 Tax=Sphingobacterium prati TaxID=2737006 RepID=UPI001553BD22|nr:pyridoxamine 5'-phosphate oxidase family protein [Sphingobacterium prati]NPE45717.1 pyridoxamine 5'-phosphate oxidase family protein [Sphingobacterium prati]
MKNKYINKSEVDKLKMMVADIDVGMMCTFSGNEQFPNVVSLKRQELDDDGVIWHLISSESISFKNLQTNDNVTLIYTKPGDLQFIRIVGNGMVSDSKIRIKKYRNHIDTKLFEKGADDPKIRVLKLKVTATQYWKSDSGSLITILKVLGRAISGRDTDFI